MTVGEAPVEVSRRLGNVAEYYFSKKLKEIAAMREAGKDVISVAIGSPDMPPHVSVTDTLSETAKREDTHGYQPYNGTLALRAAFAAFYAKTYGVKLDPASQVLPLLGSKEGILHTTMAFTNPGDTVLVPNPGYAAYTSIARLLHVKPAAYNLTEATGWQPNLSELRHLITNSRTPEGGRAKILWVNYPHMPTGANPRCGLFDDLLQLCVSEGMLLVNDNPYSLVLPTDAAAPISMLRHRSTPAHHAHCLELNSLSKSHCMPGWRVGVAVGDAKLLQSVLQVKSNFDSGMFRGIQDAAAHALTEVPPAFFAGVNKEYAARRAAVFEMMRLLRCTFSEEQVGMFIWARVPDDWECVKTKLEDILQRSYVFITPGFIFGSNGDRYIRASLCCPQGKLQEAVRRVRKYTQQASL